MAEREGFSQRLRELRKKAGLNQEEFGEITGVSVMTVRRWEWGEITPRMEEVKRIAAALRVTEAELLNGPERREFEVKILMGVKSVEAVGGLEVGDNKFLYGVEDDKPQIHIAGKIMIGTPEEREAALALLIQKFREACWMFDNRGTAAVAAGV